MGKISMKCAEVNGFLAALEEYELELELTDADKAALIAEFAENHSTREHPCATCEAEG